jgi:hypothetical protein
MLAALAALISGRQLDTVHRFLTPWGWRWHRVWVCG